MVKKVSFKDKLKFGDHLINFMRNVLFISLSIFLLAGVPLLTIGYEWFETTGAYSKIFNFDKIETAITIRWLSNYGEPIRKIINRDRETKDFYVLYNLIKRNTVFDIPENEPYAISRLAVENGAYVTLPDNNRVVLIPDDVPVFLVYCPKTSTYT